MERGAQSTRLDADEVRGWPPAAGEPLLLQLTQRLRDEGLCEQVAQVDLDRASRPFGEAKLLGCVDVFSELVVRSQPTECGALRLGEPLAHGVYYGRHLDPVQLRGISRRNVSRGEERHPCGHLLRVIDPERPDPYEVRVLHVEQGSVPFCRAGQRFHYCRQRPPLAVVTRYGHGVALAVD